jgi:hypothetical protein
MVDLLLFELSEAMQNAKRSSSASVKLSALHFAATQPPANETNSKQLFLCCECIILHISIALSENFFSL